MKRVVIGIVIGVAITLVVTYAPRFVIPVTETPGTTEPPETTETHIYIDGKIVVGGDGEPIELINNPNATDPTYAELLAFLEADQTDKYSYIVGPPKVAYICADFAKDVHNNAEAAGIGAAWVGIEIEGQTEGHALNAFETTDRGLVFIDCTGVGLWDETGDRTRWDRRAYVEVGQPYQVSYLDYYDHQHSKFNFFMYVGQTADQEYSVNLNENTLRTLEELGWLRLSTYEERLQKSQQLLEWLRTHDIYEINTIWTQEWIDQNEQKLYSWEFDEEGSGGTTFFGSEHYRTSCTLCVRADVVQGSWFEPPIWHGTIEERVIVIDEVPIVWQITWTEAGWLDPFRVWSGNELVSQGIVEDIHTHW
jgi:hypothetical protein